MSSSPCSTSRRSPRRSATSVTFQLVGPLRARPVDATARARQWRRKTNQTVVPPSVSTPQRSASRPTRKRPKPPGSSSAPIARRRREAFAVVGDLDADLGVPASRAARPARPAPPWRTALVTTSETSSRSVSTSPSPRSRRDRVAHPRARLGHRARLRRRGSVRAFRVRPSGNRRARCQGHGNRCDQRCDPSHAAMACLRRV